MSTIKLTRSMGIRLALQIIILILIVSLAIMARAGKQLSNPGHPKSTTSKLLTP